MVDDGKVAKLNFQRSVFASLPDVARGCLTMNA